MQVNFVESSPGPVKCAMAAMGLLEENYRLPMVPVRRGLIAPLRISGRARDDGPGRGNGGPMTALADDVASLVAAGPAADRELAREMFTRLRAALSTGEARAAEPDAAAPCGWRVNTWVKQGILLGFRHGDTADVSSDHGRWPFFDKDTLRSSGLSPTSRVRIVPGGSSVRDGAFIGPGVICMPPMYINIGAWSARGRWWIPTR